MSICISVGGAEPSSSSSTAVHPSGQPTGVCVYNIDEESESEEGTTVVSKDSVVFVAARNWDPHLHLRRQGDGVRPQQADNREVPVV